MKCNKGAIYRLQIVPLNRLFGGQLKQVVHVRLSKFTETKIQIYSSLTLPLEFIEELGCMNLARFS